MITHHDRARNLWAHASALSRDSAPVALSQLRTLCSYSSVGLLRSVVLDLIDKGYLRWTDPREQTHVSVLIPLISVPLSQARK